LIEEAVLQRTLQSALRHGGDFAEVFPEDRRMATERFDDGKVEEFTSGRERGAGVRVVRGDSTGYAHTADLTESGLRDAAQAVHQSARFRFTYSQQLRGDNRAAAIVADQRHQAGLGVVQS